MSLATPRLENMTLAAVVRERAKLHPERQAFVFLVDGELETASLTYGELDRRAGAIAAKLLAHARPGDRAMLLYAPGLAYVEAFFGCLYAGLAAVPVYPPRDGKTAERLIAIAKDAQAKLALTTADLMAKAGLKRWIAPGLRSMKWIATDTVTGGSCDPAQDRGAIGLIQYTSGSTGVPKGVLVSVDNLAQNAALLQAAWDASQMEADVSETSFMSWLPLYHDMGLIGKVVVPVSMGVTSVLMSPLHFLQQPMRWLDAISRHRAAVSAGPNFAYEMCARRATPEEVARLDLSCWRVAMNGAEPVRAATMAAFHQVFGPAGFRPTAFYPCYGLAEATLFVTGGVGHVAPPVLHVDAEELAAHRVVDAPGGHELVGVGRSWGSQRVVIVGEEGQPLPDDAVGEIWVSGPCVATGYWRRPEETDKTFNARLADGSGPFLRTGDLGFLRGGELFVTGRAKDLIIIRGRNLYPQDLEACVAAASPGLRAGNGAAFGVEIDGEEKLVVVQEVDKKAPPADPARTLRDVRVALSQGFDVTLHALVLVAPGALPKTSSGKIQRHRSRERYRQGGFTPWS